MADHMDALETRDAGTRAQALAAVLPRVVEAAMRAPAQAARLAGIDPAAVTDRAALARLPVLRKADLPAAQKADPPFGGFVADPPGSFARLFTSPGPIFEGERPGNDPWHMARAFFAAGFRAGDVALNTFSYHLTPGGWIMDGGLRALGCAVIPSGPGNTEAQLDLITAFRPAGYVGTPDFLKILLDAAGARDVSCVKRALVSGAAFPPSLQAEIAARGIEAFQMYGTADLGCVAYETAAREGLVVAEEVLVEIVRPGTGEPVADGEVGEVVVTVLDPAHPVLRLALGDLSAVLPGVSPCGRTNTRIVGWRGRADQTAKVKGMFVRPEQVAEIAARHPGVGRLRLVVTRVAEQDVMTLRAEAPAAMAEALAASLTAVTRLRGLVEVVPPGSLPNDGKAIADERPLN
ncbi:phenylacetate--CoA ligase family protein [Roseomonas sp. CECT 9278]|uniref:phenylacetate--CoA ligase family protein n=1 Tax=Roseomonas sp. CECT 9278 TaxID=2845823 RepID=UPI001E46EB39|nr:AMP-binding protein [Roseomonas sp. CECT 9278]CAH0225570.1 Phenylacetate-coenzyme A ligase [Roseomonas sp. CECT 9278]